VDRGGPPRDRGGPPPEPPDHEPPGGRDSAKRMAPSAIQWFASLESGFKEAKRSGRPILLVSAAPHCAGIPGTW
jgi:hypothetical protein